MEPRNVEETEIFGAQNNAHGIPGLSGVGRHLWSDDFPEHAQYLAGRRVPFLYVLL